jgi:phosphoglycolate phosphatase
MTLPSFDSFATDRDLPFPDHTDRVAIFDLDGTLVDSVDSITLAMNRLLRTVRAAPLHRAEAATLLGDGLEAFAMRASTLRQVTLTDEAMQCFIRDYLTDPLTGAKLYDGVDKTLSLLAQTGWHLAVCTNKIEAAAITLLGGLDILGYFDIVCGGDTVACRKPSPLHLDQTLMRGQLQGLPAVMIGDNSVDMAAASAYGIPSVFAAWGYGAMPPHQHVPFVAAAFRGLPRLLDQIVPLPNRDHAATKHGIENG